MTDDRRWSSIDDLAEQLLLPADPELDVVLAATEAAGLPSIQVSALQGALLALLARAVGASQVLEIGTLGGYSTLWLARALPAHGRVVSLEADPGHAAVAVENLAAAGVGDRVEVWVGDARATLPRLAGEGAVFDLVFVDADKAATPAYLDLVLPMTRSGGLVVVDNVARHGDLADPHHADRPDVVGMRRSLELLGSDPRVAAATLVQTVGAKGYDGFALALVA